MPELENGFIPPEEQQDNNLPEQSKQKSEIDATKYERYVGARLLSKIGAENKYSHIAQKSLEIAKTRHEKIQGNNSERRNFTMLERLEQFVERHGSEGEKRILEMSSSNLIIQPEDFTEGYWRTQEQILRDNGQGRELSQREKDYLIEDIQKNQRESLQPWIDYLSAENSPYPVWFKMYAWEGMSKMGVFDTDKKQFAKRDKTTVAPYPKLNPAALAKVYGAIMDFYGIDQADYYSDGDTQQQEMAALIQSDNFNKLYSKIMLESKVVIRSPENPQDVDGEWIEYLPGDEEKLAAAAEGTPWCVANPGTGKNYLETGGYSGGGEVDLQDNHAKFILFHLRDKDTGQVASNACASVRLGTDGRVAEISGLNSGQALEDSLVPTVEAKVKSLPGGEDFLEAFADKQTLIAIDHKVQAGEDLTKGELEFVYEINRPIKTLDTYNEYDPRIEEIKEKYPVGKALKVGIKPEKLILKLDRDIISDNFDELLAATADIDNFAINLCQRSARIFFDRLETLVNANINIHTIDYLVTKLDADDILEHLDELLSAGADINNIITHYGPYNFAQNLNKLLPTGVAIDNIVAKLAPEYIANFLDKFLATPANIDNIVTHLEPHTIAYHLKELLLAGAQIDVNELVTKLQPHTIAEHLDKLLPAGAHIDVNKLVTELESDDIAVNLDKLLAAKAQIDVNKLVTKLSPEQIALSLDKLLAAKAQIDVNELVTKLQPHTIAEHLDKLLPAGAHIDVNKLVTELESNDIAVNLDKLLDAGADPEKLQRLL